MTLKTPAEGKTDVGMTPTLKWTSDALSTEKVVYTVFIYGQSNGQTFEKNVKSLSTQVPMTDALPPNNDLSWYVVVNGGTTPSATGHFSTGTYPFITNVLPATMTAGADTVSNSTEPVVRPTCFRPTYPVEIIGDNFGDGGSVLVAGQDIDGTYGMMNDWSSNDIKFYLPKAEGLATVLNSKVSICVQTAAGMSNVVKILIVSGGGGWAY